MYTGNTISYRAIMDKQFRDFGFEIKDEAGMEWLAEFMAQTKVGIVMDNSVEYLEVCDGRVKLPFNLYKIVQVAKLEGVANLSKAECAQGRILPMRWATDNFHSRYHRDDRDYTSQSANTYTVNNGYIFTSFSKGYLAVAIEALPVDEEGYPVIPAEQSWMEAASHHIAWKQARRLRRTNSIDKDFYMEIMQDKEWYFAQAVNQAKLDQNVDQAESFKNSIVRTIPDIQAHASFFANLQLPEERNFRDSSSTGHSTPSTITQSPTNIAT